MRKLGDALLIAPALALLLLATLWGHVRRRPVIGVVAVIAIGTVALVALQRPVPSAATQPTVSHPVSAELLDAVRTGHGLRTPFTVSFDGAMDTSSVAGALRISPDAAVTFSWDAAGKTLTVTPVDAWEAGTLYTISIDTSARGADGGPLTAPVHAVVLTAGQAAGTISATKTSGGKARLDTSFAITLDHSATLAAVQAALVVVPELPGVMTAGEASGAFVFTPDRTLLPATNYTVALPNLQDVNGLPFDPVPTLTIGTADAPQVVRFRPLDGSKSIDRVTALSVRFTAGMERKSTAAAFSATVNGKPISGKISWAEKDTVLIFKPSAVLPYSAVVVMSVADSAASKALAPLAAADTGTFTVAAKPAKPKPAVLPIPHSGGGGAVAGTWAAVEAYYLQLMNCTRQGGRVTSKATCSSPGGRNVPALVMDAGISAKVTRPYAKLLATRGLCNHYFDGAPWDRLRRAGYRAMPVGENIGCGNQSPYKAMLADQLYFQAEGYGGGHYRNLMNPVYGHVGIGVWVAKGYCRLVIDFYP